MLLQRESATAIPSSMEPAGRTSVKMIVLACDTSRRLDRYQETGACSLGDIDSSPQREQLLDHVEIVSEARQCWAAESDDERD